MRTSIPTLPDHIRYIAIEGVIGVGKTSLARMLAETFKARLVLEEFEENPFLARFYEDPERWALQTQLSFLVSRYYQQKQLLTPDLFQQVTVSDYLFDKDRIFARLNLEGEELQLYETLYAIMEPTTPTPDLVIYLQASVDRLMQNIARRGRTYERHITRDYLTALQEAYTRYFFYYYKRPLLIINVTHIDFVQCPEDFEKLLRMIADPTLRGITYFNPEPSRFGEKK